jgi:hypothetical protein
MLNLAVIGAQRRRGRRAFSRRCANSPAIPLFETLEAPPEHRGWRSVPPKSADHLGITVSPAPVPPPGDHIALICGGACSRAQPAPGCPDINQFGKDRGTGSVPVRLAHSGLSGGTHFAELQITTSGSLSLRAANEGGLELAGEVPGVARGLAKVGMTMIIVTHEVLYEVVVGQGPPGWLLGYPVHERTRRFLRRVAYEEDIAA